MALTPAQIEVTAHAIREAASAVWQVLPDMNSQDVTDAVEAADIWKDAAKTSYNNALPDVFRNNATGAQKTLVLQCVVMVDYLLDDPDAVQVLSLLVGELMQRMGE
jgi:hypothetical protein